MSFRHRETRDNFSGGFNSRDNDKHLQDIESPNMRNTIMGMRGGIEPRPGTAMIGTSPVGADPGDGYPPVTSLYQFITNGGNEFLLAFAGNELKYLMGDVWTLVNDTLTANTFLEFITYPIYPYDYPMMNCLFVNGEDGYWQTNGLTAKQVTQYVTEVHDIEGELIDEAVEIGTSSMPTKAKYIEYFDNRIWLANVEGSRDRIYMNVDDIYGNSMYNYFTPWSWIRIQSMRGEQITGIKAFKKSLLVFTPTTISAILPADPIELEGVIYTPPAYEAVEISSTIGCVASRSIQEVRGNLVFMGIDGVYMFDGSSAPFKVSQRIDPTIESIDHSFWSRACASVWKAKYLLSVPIEG